MENVDLNWVCPWYNNEEDWEPEGNNYMLYSAKRMTNRYREMWIGDTFKIKTFYAVGECMTSRDFWENPDIK